MLELFGQLNELCAGAIHGPGQLGEVHFHLPKLAGHVGGSSLKGAHQGLILAAEELHGFLQLLDGGLFQIVRPLTGLALDGADALAELDIALGVGLEMGDLRFQSGDLVLQSLIRLQLCPGGSFRCQLRFQLVFLKGNGIQLDEEGVASLGQLLHLSAEAVVFLLKLLLRRRSLLSSLFDIRNDVLLVKTAERYTFDRIVFHGNTTFLRLWLLFYHENRRMTRVALFQNFFKKIEKKTCILESDVVLYQCCPGKPGGKCAVSSAG